MKYSVYFLIGLGASIIIINISQTEWFLDTLLGIKWSKPIISVLKANTQGLIVAFLVSLYLDVVRSKKGSIKIVEEDIYISNGISEVLANIESKEIIKLFLKKKFAIYNKKGNISSLIDQISPNKTVYTDVNIKYSIQNNIEDDSKYFLEYEIESTANLSEYLIAFVSKNELQERISNSCPLISDVITIPTLQSNPQTIDAIIQKTDFFAMSKNSGSEVSKIKISLSRCTSKTIIRKSLNKIPEHDRSSVVLVRAIIKQVPDKFCSYLLKTPRMELDKDDHYVYWISDRVMWVNKIVFDASGFTYNEAQRFNIQPMIINYKKSANLDSRNGIFTIWIHDWIGNGNAVIFSWR